MKSLPIHLDRLQNALQSQGFNLRRHQALSILASTLGYHNQNELTAAHKRGEIDPPKAAVIGQFNLPDGTPILILNDPISRQAYGLNPSQVKVGADRVRKDSFGISPYGNLLDYRGLCFPCGQDPALILSAKSTSTITVHAAEISHSHGTDLRLAASAENLTREIARYCHENWSAGENPSHGHSDAALVQAYFEAHTDEGLTETTFELEIPLLPPNPRHSTVNHQPAYSEKERDLILAALRHWQASSKDQIQPEILAIASSGSGAYLGDAAIDHLCETINSAPVKKEPEADGASVGGLIDEFAGGDPWGQHPYFDREAWAYAVQNEETGASYWEWVASEIESSTSSQAEDDKAIYLTNGICENTGHADEGLFQRLGLKFSRDENGSFYPLAGRELSLIADQYISIPNGASFLCGYSWLSDGEKYLSPSAELCFETEDERNSLSEFISSYAAGLRRRLCRIGAYVQVEEEDDRFSLTVAVPMDYALRAVSGKKPFEIWDTWKAHLTDLLIPSDCPRILARFHPQAWINDQAISVDPEGPVEWDITAYVLTLGEKDASLIKDNSYESDNLRSQTDAPDWVKNWSGPFFVEVEDQIEAFFQFWSKDKA